jgi:hypothetical protein
VAAFRTAQIARNRRISAWAQNLLIRLRNRPDGDIERASVVHRTLCDVLCTMCDVLCTMFDVRWPNPHRRSERPSTKLVL